MSIHVRYTATPHLEDAAIAKTYGPSIKVLEAPYLAGYDGRNVIDFPVLNSARYLDLMSTDDYTNYFPPKPTTLSRAKSAMLKASFRRKSSVSEAQIFGASSADLLNQSKTSAGEGGLSRTGSNVNDSAAASSSKNPRRPSNVGEASFKRRSSSYHQGGASASMRKRSIRIVAPQGPAVTKTAVERAQQQLEERALQMFKRVAPKNVPVVEQNSVRELTASLASEENTYSQEMRKHSTYFTPNVARVVDHQAASRFSEAVLREENNTSQAASLVSGKGKKDKDSDGKKQSGTSASSLISSSAISGSVGAKLAAQAAAGAGLSAPGSPKNKSGLDTTASGGSASPNLGNTVTSLDNADEPAELNILNHALLHHNASHRKKQTALTALIPATEQQQREQHYEEFAKKITPLPIAGTLRETDDNIQEELCSQAARALTMRQSFTVINMGMCQCGKTAFGTQLVDKLIESAGPAIERALETHADELARAREDALLLASAQAAANDKKRLAAMEEQQQDEHNNDHEGGEDAQQQHLTGKDVPPLGIKGSMKGNLGAFLRSRSPRSQHGGTARSFTSTARTYDEPSSRFVLYVPAVSRPLPAVKVESHLVPSEIVLNQLGIETPRQIPSGRAASEFWLGLSEEEEAAARREELESLQALQKAQQKYTFGRKSSFKLKQNLYELVEGNRFLDIKNLEGNGRGESWNVLHWNGVDSILELPPIPQLEVGIKSFMLDFWIYRPSNARRGSDHDPFNTPEILLQISEPSSEKGMLLRVGINTALPGTAGSTGDNCEVLQLLVRDANNRNMEVVLPLTDYCILNHDEFHHIFISVKSLEDTQTEIRIDGHVGRVQYAQMERPNVFGAWLQQKVNVGATRDAVGGVEQCFFGSICELRMWRHPEGPSRFDSKLQTALAEYRRAEMQRQLEGHALEERGASAYSLMHEGKRRQSPPSGLGVSSLTGGDVSMSKAGGSTSINSPTSEGSLPSLAPLLRLNVDRPLRAEFAPCWSWSLEPQVSATPFDMDDQDPETLPPEIIELEQGATLEENEEFRPASPNSPGAKQQQGAAANKAAAIAAQQQQQVQLAEGVVGQPKITALRPAGYDCPKTCPWFDGQRLCVNMTPLGPFGEYLHSFNIEIRFRCSNNKRVQSLFGVTDTQVKKQEIGIVLNAEPAMGSIHASAAGTGSSGPVDRYKFHPNSITMFLVDATGRCLSAVLRGTERSNLIDGKWHTLVWRVLDSETNKLEVKVDNSPQEAVIAVKESPKNFVAFKQWICLGGHNVRDWKVKNIFEGTINKCAIAVRGEALVEYKMAEGNGATIAIDETGHSYHGTYWDPQFQRHHGKYSVLWVAQRDDADKKKGDDDDDSLEHVVHMRNDVRFALLCLTISMDVAAGKAVERCYDLLRDPSLVAPEQNDNALTRPSFTRHAVTASNQHDRNDNNNGGEEVPLKFDPKCTAPYVEPVWGPTTMRCYADEVDEDSSQTRTKSQVPHRLVNEEFLRLPDHVYRDAETTKQVRREISRVMKAHASLVREGKAGVLDGHILVVIAIGDARLAYIDLRGPFWPHHSQYDLNMKRWTAPVSSAHGEARRAMMLNLMTLSVEKALLASSRVPTLARRTNCFQKAKNLVRHLDCHAMPDNIGGLLHWLLLDIEFANHVHLINSLWKVHSEDDAAWFSVFNKTLTEATELPAALMIQKAWRGHVARRLANNMSMLREIRRSKVDEINLLRKSLPNVVLPKKTMTALVILNLRSGAISRQRQASGAPPGLSPDGRLKAELDSERFPEIVPGASSNPAKKQQPSTTSSNALQAQANQAAYFDCLDNSHWLPPIDPIGPQSVIAGLNSQGYVVHKLIDPTRDEILEAVRSLDPSHTNFVYMCGYGTSTLRYPVNHSYECHFLEQKEEYMRGCVDRDFLNGLKDLKKSCDAGMKDLIEKRDAALASKKKKKKAGAGSSIRRPAPPPAAGMASSGRRGQSRAAAAAEAAQAAAAAQTQITLQLRETDYSEAQARTDLQNLFQHERNVLREEFEDLVAQTRLFEDACVGKIVGSTKEANSLLPMLAFVPSNCDCTDPSHEDVVLVQEIYDELFRREIPFGGESFPPDCPAIPSPDDPCRGMQNFLAIDILPMNEAMPRYHGTVDRSKALAPLTPLPNISGCSIIAASTGHSQVYFHESLRQKMMLTWHLRKVLIGHVDENFGDRQHPEKMLNGGVCDPEPGQRDVPSIFEYLDKKLAKKTSPELQTRMKKINQVLDSNFIYYGDVLPVRNELMNNENRHQLSRQAESKRIHALALVASKPERGAGEIQNELQAHLSDMQTVEVVPQGSLLLTFLRQVRPPVLRTLDHIDLQAVHKFVKRCIPRHYLPPEDDDDIAGNSSTNLAVSSMMAASASTKPSVPQYVQYDVTANALGVRVDFHGLTDKNKLVAVISSVALKLTTASFPARKTSSDVAFYCDDGHEDAPSSAAFSSPTYDVNDVEALYTVRGVTNARRFKNVLKRWCHNPNVGTSVRVISAHGYSSVDNSEAGFSYM